MSRRKFKRLDRSICGLCDASYDPLDLEEAKIHEHPEPQSGEFRELWLASGMHYERWIVETKEGQAWAEYRRSLGIA
jgi:hypothetical protein